MFTVYPEYEDIYSTG